MGRNTWPINCIWPEPTEESSFWEADDADHLLLDDEAQELLDIKDYFDELVEEGRLNEDYSLNEDYEEDEEFTPEIGIDYWDDGFDIEGWTEDLTNHINLLKLPLPSPVDEIERIIGYNFINENLLRQAFTRRAYTIQYGLPECSEELEFYGDSIINTVVTREIYKRFSDTDAYNVDGPFKSQYDEGDLTKIRSKFVSKEYLAARAAELGLDKFILYGTGEEATESSREDMMEALIGAVAADCDWEWPVLEDVIDKLLNLQLDKPSLLLKVSNYEQLNSWHQKRFGRMPQYEVLRREDRYDCDLRFSIPANDNGIWTEQRIRTEGAPTRSAAREYVADRAVSFIKGHGLWIRLEDAGVVPNLEDSINQLQELYQKKYVEKPEYTFEERDDWLCFCHCNGIDGWGKATGKTAAKKKAAYMVLVRLLMSAGLSNEEMEREMWKTTLS